MRVAAVPLTALILALVATGCGAPEPPAHEDGAWVGTITTEDDVTTVVNESGSVWGGTARLVEEASIGMAEGPEEQLFGYLGGVGMTQDRIVVLDRQLRTIRVYDVDGNHLADCAASGQGPGEIDPSGLVVQFGTSPDGRIFVHAGSEIEVYSADCEHLETYPVRERMTLGTPMTVSEDGVPYLSVPIDRKGRLNEWTYGMQAFGSEGPVGVPIPQPILDFERVEIEVHERLNSGAVAKTWTSPPYTPDFVWEMMPSKAVVGGISSDYSFEIIHPDGHRTVVKNPWWDPVPLSGDEADWYARRFLAQLHGERAVDPPSWDPSELPDTKLAFRRFISDRDNRLWVLRPGHGERIPGCNEEAEASAEFREAPCWQDRTVVEVFGSDGRFLGQVNFPDLMRWSPRPYIRNDLVLAVFEDEAGTIMVKRYRLVLPTENSR